MGVHTIGLFSSLFSYPSFRFCCFFFFFPNTKTFFADVDENPWIFFPKANPTPLPGLISCCAVCATPKLKKESFLSPLSPGNPLLTWLLTLFLRPLFSQRCLVGLRATPYVCPYGGRSSFFFPNPLVFSVPLPWDHFLELPTLGGRSLPPIRELARRGFSAIIFFFPTLTDSA